MSMFAGSNGAETIDTLREFLNLTPPEIEKTAAEETGETDPAQPLAYPCPYCGGRMFIIETFEPGRQPRHRPTAPLVSIMIDTSRSRAQSLASSRAFCAGHRPSTPPPGLIGARHRP